MTLDGAQKEAQRRADTLGKTYAVCKLPQREAYIVIPEATYLAAPALGDLLDAHSFHSPS